ncbi:Uncharacterised protein [Mycobacteroides abscessus subsp. abscessus]|nr:Uncharacterised protein [Mycobacteroides abscessus subsp. abscessus]
MRAESTQTGTSLSIARNAVTTLTPSSTGMLISSTIASGRCSVAQRSASAPSLAVFTSNPERRRPRSSEASTSASSSTTSTRGEPCPSTMPAILPDEMGKTVELSSPVLCRASPVS